MQLCKFDRFCFCSSLISASSALCEMIVDQIGSWFPFYFEAKVLFIFWLILPQFEGATVLYHHLIEPYLVIYEEDIDNTLHQVRTRANSQVELFRENGVAFLKAKSTEVLAMVSLFCAFDVL